MACVLVGEMEGRHRNEDFPVFRDFDGGVLRCRWHVFRIGNRNRRRTGQGFGEAAVVREIHPHGELPADILKAHPVGARPGILNVHRHAFVQANPLVAVAGVCDAVAVGNVCGGRRQSLAHGDGAGNGRRTRCRMVGCPRGGAGAGHRRPGAETVQCPHFQTVGRAAAQVVERGAQASGLGPVRIPGRRCPLPEAISIGSNHRAAVIDRWAPVEHQTVVAEGARIEVCRRPWHGQGQVGDADGAEAARVVAGNVLDRIGGRRRVADRHALAPAHRRGERERHRVAAHRDSRHARRRARDADRESGRRRPGPRVERLVELQLQHRAGDGRAAAEQPGPDRIGHDRRCRAGARFRIERVVLEGGPHLQALADIRLGHRIGAVGLPGYVRLPVPVDADPLIGHAGAREPVLVGDRARTGSQRLADLRRAGYGGCARGGLVHGRDVLHIAARERLCRHPSGILYFPHAPAGRPGIGDRHGPVRRHAPRQRKPESARTGKLDPDDRYCLAIRLDRECARRRSGAGLQVMIEGHVQPVPEHLQRGRHGRRTDRIVAAGRPGIARERFERARLVQVVDPQFQPRADIVVGQRVAGARRDLDIAIVAVRIAAQPGVAQRRGIDPVGVRDIAERRGGPVARPCDRVARNSGAAGGIARQ